MRILLIEDDIDLAENIIDYLEESGYDLDYAMSGEQGLTLLKANPYDALILDIGLPGIDGFAVCEYCRKQYRLSLPILMLTARTQLDDKLHGFESGTDDYLPKPFELAELEVRIQALARRSRPVQPRVLTLADLIYDLDRNEVRRGGDLINLPPVCAQILRALMEASPRTLTRSDLEYLIWRDNPPETDALKAHFYTLRQMVDKPYPVPLLKTVRGQGYRIEAPPL